jgi:A/G-specific adenine glycosylase
MMQLQETILTWYKKEGRKLPWRETTNPYKILVSEMMLQQTQVDRVIPKYHAFLKQFPTPKILAEASTADVLKVWSGLGYNRRALYLKKCAEAIVSEHNNMFPETKEALQALPGIGLYTAAAILSFAYNKDITVIDVNIERIFKRVFFTKIDNNVEAIAQHALPQNQSRDWHNALMDLGSICTATNPECHVCPINKLCDSNNNQERITATWKKKKVVPFKESDRIVRGTILKILTKHNKLSINKTIAILESINIKRTKEKFHQIIKQLEKDELVVEQNEMLLLP